MGGKNVEEKYKYIKKIRIINRNVYSEKLQFTSLA